MGRVNVNGGSVVVSRVESVRRVAPGHYVVRAAHGVYHVVGGRAAGGARDEWYVVGPETNIRCTSVLDAVRCAARAPSERSGGE